jgi:hypothetical protein
MSKNLSKIIFAVLAILAVVTFIPWIYGQIFPEKNELAKKTSVDLSGFAKDTVSRISIKNGAGEETLSFENGIWKINDSKADPEKITSLFQSFFSLKIKEMAAENEISHEKFQVTESSGTRLKITKNSEDFIFFIGKAGPAGTDFYIRKDGIKNVYLASGDLKEKLLLKQDDWKKKEENKTEK